jgi:hypothetical protein
MAMLRGRDHVIELANASYDRLPRLSGTLRRFLLGGLRKRSCCLPLADPHGSRLLLQHRGARPQPLVAANPTGESSTRLGWILAAILHSDQAFTAPYP